ncbi:MAG: PD40 domain-containing protein [Verrucomicrobia bacterium]|nr:PD40 domain-containing protein [Verrucomicrobiota bacterium]
MPAGPYVFLSAQERDGFNQGGDGVDWHPTLNEVVATVASDVPAIGTAGRTSLGGTVLAVFSTTSISPFLRKLTNPVGEANAFFDLSTLIYSIATPHDYAPAISPNGTRVTYVRHTLRQDTRYDGVAIAPMPAICSIRVINYDGTGDREVLRMAEGLWVTKIAWSPEGSQIAFDLSPQQVLNGWNSLSGDATQSAIYVVNENGTNPHLLAAAPAAYPTWAASQSAARPGLQIRRDGNGLELRIDQLTPGRGFVVERSIALPTWTPLATLVATNSTQLLTITPNAGERFAVYRIRVP